MSTKLETLDQTRNITHVIFEARGRKEDCELGLEFRRVCDKGNALGVQLPFKIFIADKKTNSEGLQFADMVARPVGLSIIRPEESNRALRVLENKIYKVLGEDGVIQEPYLYPYKAKGLKVAFEAQTPVG